MFSKFSISALAAVAFAGVVACDKGASSDGAAAAVQAPADISSAAVVYTADPAASRVGWKGSKLYELDEHTGTIDLKSGQLGFTDGKPVAGTFVIDMNSIKNSDITNAEYNAKLVGHLKNDDFFSVDTYPTAEFAIVSVKPGQGEGQYLVTGNLTIKGKTREVTAPATIAADDNGAKASAEFEFDRTQFDVRYGSESVFTDLAQDKVIDDKIEIVLDVALNK